MARFSGAAVLLILLATVSVYTCAFLSGAVLGRTLERRPPDSVSVRGVVDHFAKELWGGDREGGGDHAGDGAAWVILDTVDASDQASPQAKQTITRPRRSRDDDQRVARRPRHSNFSGEITRGPNSPRGVVKVGPWGGSGGQPFYMRGTAVPRLSSVTLYHSDAIHAFSYELILQSGVRQTQGPSGRHSYGSTGARATINLSSDEHLVVVEGTSGHYGGVAGAVITSLTFRTDKGRQFGPYGKKAGTPFSIPAANGCIVGFWGRSGWLLDAVGVYISPCLVYRPASEATPVVTFQGTWGKEK